MVRHPVRTFFILILLGLLALSIDLPENRKVSVTLFGRKIDTVINPIALDVSLFNMRIRKTFSTRLGLDLAGGTQVVLQADMSDIPKNDRFSALESAKGVIERRVNFFGVSEPVVQTAVSEGNYRIVVELPGVTDTEDAIRLIGQTAKLEFREFTETPSSTESAYIFPTLENTTSVGITGKDLKHAEMTFSSQTGEPEVTIEFTKEGASMFGDVTTRLVGKQLPIFLDSCPLTWPKVNTPITDGIGVISGSFTRDAAKELALQLNAGALPVPVTVVQKRTVGASLGQSSVASSLQAGLVGLAMVGLFMIAKYGYLGLLADMALILYGLLSFAVFRWIPITLTLPGIAGFFLSVGMAVDANILIFERYREELRKGKPWHIAMELGFGKAWESIRDANFTTVLTSLILYNPGNWQFLPSSGLVRGFAATLLIGVLISLFTGIVVTRTFIRVLYRPRPVKGGRV